MIRAGCIALSCCAFLVGCGDDAASALDGSTSGASTSSSGETSSSSSADTSGATQGTSTGSTTGAESTDDSGSESTTTSSEPDPYGGEWCGTTGTGLQMLGPIAAFARFAPSHGGPRA